MKDCCPDEETLSQFYDGELQDESLGSHIEVCPECKSMLEDYARLDALVRVAQPLSRRTSSSRRWRSSALMAAGLLLCLGLATYLTTSSQSKTESYTIAAEGKNYIVSLEGDAYLVSMQIGDVLMTYRED